jgi:hypothetical protein
MTHISTLKLHRLRLGELEPAERAPLEAHLAACPLCAGRLGHQEDARAAFVGAPVPEALRAAASAPPSLWERLGRLRAALVLLPMATAAAAVALALRAPPPTATERTKGDVHHAAPALEPERAKGHAPKLEAWIETGTSARPLYTGEVVRAGARVQLTYDPGQRRFVTLAGRDAQGVVEIYGTLPASGPGVAPAPFALTLDETRGEQHFFAVLTDTRPDPRDILSALATSPVRMERGEVTSLVIRKE